MVSYSSMMSLGARYIRVYVRDRVIKFKYINKYIYFYNYYSFMFSIRCLSALDFQLNLKIVHCRTHSKRCFEQDFFRIQVSNSRLLIKVKQFYKCIMICDIL